MYFRLRDYNILNSTTAPNESFIHIKKIDRRKITISHEWIQWYEEAKINCSPIQENDEFYF